MSGGRRKASPHWLYRYSKKGNTQDIANYRPISLLTCTYKIFTSILQTRIASIIDPHLARTQYGFRSSHSTQQPVIQDIAEVSGGELLLLTFLDWKQAFDKINHHRMLEVLERMNIPPKMLRITKALYRNPSFQVQHDEFASQEYFQQCGIRQGCPLSPCLFIIVMSVLFADIRRDHHRALSHGKLGHLSFMEVLYADDTLLVTKNTRTMNGLLHAVKSESQYCGLKLNQSKCACHHKYRTTWNQISGRDACTPWRSSYFSGRHHYLTSQHMCRNRKQNCCHHGYMETDARSLQKFQLSYFAGNW